MRFEVNGKQRFFEFTPESLILRQKEIFGELLRNRTAAFFKGSVLQIDEYGASDSLQVNAVMVVKAAIFDGNDGVLYVSGNVGERNVMVSIHACVNGFTEINESMQTIRQGKGA